VEISVTTFKLINMAETENKNLPEKRIEKQHIKLIILLVMAVLLVVFAIQNSQEVMIRLWFWRFYTSMALALIICIASGFLLSFWYFLPLINGKNRIISAKDKEILRLKGQSMTDAGRNINR
jgi:lipopolysaccharide assembly protein A